MLRRQILILCLLYGCAFPTLSEVKESPCPDVHDADFNFYNDKTRRCYYVHQPTDWVYLQAKTWCHAHGLHVVTLETKDEEIWIEQRLAEKAITGFQYWLGLESVCGSWTWVRGRSSEHPGEITGRWSRTLVTNPSHVYAYVDNRNGWESINDDPSHERAAICETSVHQYMQTETVFTAVNQSIKLRGKQLEDPSRYPSLHASAGRCLREDVCSTIAYSSLSKQCYVLSTSAGDPLLPDLDSDFHPFYIGDLC